MKRENWVALDGLRGISILFVVLVHLWAHASPTGNGLPIALTVGEQLVDITWIFATGHNTVVTFFVLSGFLLYRHWLERGGAEPLWKQAIQFYRKRAQRILPAFLFFNATWLILVALLGKHHFGADITTANVLLNLSFLSPIAAATGSTAASSLDIASGTWSLNAEMWFYLAMPGLAYLLMKTPANWIVLIAISTGSLAYRFILGPEPNFIARFSLPGVADAFMLGMAVAALSANGKISKMAGPLFPIGATWYVAICASVIPIQFDNAFQLAAASSMMIAGLIAPGNWAWKRWLAGPAIVRIGHISFSMFLCNTMVAWYIVLPVSQVTGIESPEGRLAMNLFLGYPLIYLISWAGYRFIETPLLAREILMPRQMMRHGLAIACAIVSVSIIPSIAAHVLRDGMGAEYSGTLPRLVSLLVPTSMTGRSFRTLSMNGSPIVDSESKLAAVSVRYISDDEIHVTSSGVKTGDHWVAVMLPIDEQEVTRGKPIYMTAILVTAQPYKIEACLGIYNGKQDTCSERKPLATTRRFEVQSLIGHDGLLQFKLNIFPDAEGQPFDVQLRNVRIYQSKA